MLQMSQRPDAASESPAFSLNLKWVFSISSDLLQNKLDVT